MSTLRLGLAVENQQLIVRLFDVDEDGRETLESETSIPVSDITNAAEVYEDIGRMRCGKR